ncbi:MAG TPA: fumarylacetoacetate hydrolase family protein [Bosea sp. (in: a-proteobacteria)]|jgi:fumarylacetoacetate (FAA) hydrolase|uniref:fumarylacetoacetate hydrolase family protein n=1 Tax=Bosea sp. (in: a-proteobacteria) TaxID=1871050 RepID=UPI002E13B62F|nr:fumarylacetoacetate hydrolase family protein [Bosea sp. (in: a-proteobacteria)]
MKLASLMHGRDGRLVVVSQDLTRATDAFPVVATLQAALDDWERYAPRLADLAEGLEHGAVPSFRFHEHDCAAPLPRAYQRLAAPAADAPLRHESADTPLGSREPFRSASDEGGIGFQAEVVVVTGDVPMGVTGEAALDHIRLVMLANGAGLQSDAGATAKPSGAYSPVAVTPDELGQGWRDGKGHLLLLTQINGKLVGKPDVGAGTTSGFGALIAQAARRRRLGAGTLVAAALAGQGPDRLRFGDTVRLEMKDAAGHSIFGAIEQEILPGG